MRRKDEYLTSEQLRRMLNVSKQFIQAHRASRRLPGMVKVGAIWRFKRSEVERRIAQGELLLPKSKGRTDGTGNKNS